MIPTAMVMGDGVGVGVGNWYLLDGEWIRLFARRVSGRFFLFKEDAIP
jgi:hypothetical protein